MSAKDRQGCKHCGRMQKFKLGSPMYALIQSECSKIANLANNAPKDNTFDYLSRLIERISYLKGAAADIAAIFRYHAEEAQQAAIKVENIRGFIANAKRGIEQKYNCQYKILRRLANEAIRDSRLRNAVFSRDANKCLACGSSDCLSVDHIIPVKDGGSNSIENLQTLCLTCNLKKGIASTNYVKPNYEPTNRTTD